MDVRSIFGLRYIHFLLTCEICKCWDCYCYPHIYLRSYTNADVPLIDGNLITHFLRYLSAAIGFLTGTND